jgi:heat-inducible transcriptional repressor
MSLHMQLTERQARLLKAVIIEHQATQRPVGSRTLVERGVVAASASTIRYELGRLEEIGLLEHPHTSAGRVPTDLGYRMYVDRLVDSADLAASRRTAAPVERAARLDEAIAHVTQALAEATELLALVTAPAARGAVIRHIEVVQLQATRLVVVCITAAGDVTRHVVDSGIPIDGGLVDWAGAYLNETVCGMALGQNLLRARLADPQLHPAERAILALLAPAFTDLIDDEQDVHVGATPEQLRALGSDVQGIVNLVHVLEERQRLLGAIRRVASAGHGVAHPAARRVSVRIGAENDLPELQPLSVVSAQYGLATRQLGVVGLIGPRSMDYPQAMRAVHMAADTLSLVAEDLHAAG